jgi:RHS repeat-associated protein
VSEGGFVKSVAVTVSAYTEVRTAIASPAGAPERVERHWFYDRDLDQPVTSSPGAPYRNFTELETRFNPRPYEGREYKTELVGASTTLKVWTMGERLAAGHTSRTPVVCQENTTLSGMTKASVKLFRYDRDESGTALASDQRFENLSDVYEFDFTDALAPMTETSAGKTYHLCDTAIPATYTRRTHTDYVGDSSYVNDPVHLTALPFSVKVWKAGGVLASESRTTYDNRTAAAELGCTIARTLHNPGTVLQHDDGYLGALTARGNAVCTSRRVKISPNTWITSMAKYEKTGMPMESYDARGYKTSFDNSDNFVAGTTAPTGVLRAFPKIVTNALNQTVETGYHYPLGVPSTIKDANGQTTSLFYTDPLDRLTDITLPIGATKFVYQDSLKQLTIQRRLAGSPAVQWVESRRTYDGFGRQVLQEQKVGTNAWVKTGTLYDGLGRVWKVSNPYAGTQADAWTESQYDAAGRRKLEKAPGNAETTWEYISETVEITDPAGKKRKQWNDGLGRLVKVVEDPGEEEPFRNYVTEYAYGGQDQLETVTQDTQTRSFVYDLAGRLTSALNPESQTTTYTYDGAGNLLTRVANGDTVTMTYDALSRIRSKEYTGTHSTPGVTYCYDGDITVTGCESAPSGANVNLKGRLTMVTNSAATMKYSVYDALGRVTSHEVAVTGYVNPFVFSYEYNELALKKTTYPSGREVSQEYDAAGRIASVSGTKSGTVTNYVTGVTYAPHGGLSEITVAGGARTEQWCYNNRMQPEVIRLGSATSPGCIADSGDLLRLSYTYGTSDATNNGNPATQTVSRNNGGFSAVETYTYDPLNRLRTAGSTGWSQTYVYDRFGNRAVLGTSTIPASGQTPVVSQDTEAAVRQIFPSNRWSGATHDNGGNQLTRFGGQFSYDAENRLKQATIGTTVTEYSYDGEGRRVKKGGTTYVYDAFGQLAAEYGGTNPLSGTRYLTADHLGSTRLVTDAAGGSQQCSDYFPFGEELAAGTGSRPACYSGAIEPTQKFTGKERDGETGLDYFIARYFSGAQGRFTSPDKPFADQNLTNPQSWNLYAYVRNNPLIMVDPSGSAALLITNRKTNERTLRIPVSFSGAGATPENILKIVSRANALNTGESGVKVEVVATDKKDHGVLNKLDLSPGYDYKKYPGAGEGVNELGGNKGHINSDAAESTGAAVHDILHFAGIEDQYKENPPDSQGNRVAEPKPGYDESNIMTSRTGTNLNSQQIQQAEKNKTTKTCTVEDGKTKCH